MSRLVDIEDIAICGWYMEDDDGEVYIKLADVEMCIANAPTAYDVEEDAEEKANALEKKSFIVYEYVNDVQRGFHAVRLDDAIEIVRGGRNE